MQEVTDQILDEGMQLFAEAFDKLLRRWRSRSRSAGAGKVNCLTYELPGPCRGLNDFAEGLACAGQGRRLWAGDPSLWTGRDEAQWLGWLGVTKGSSPTSNA